jgi:hypothetical protein
MSKKKKKRQEVAMHLRKLEETNHESQGNET